MDRLGTVVTIATTFGRIAGFLAEEFGVAHFGPRGGGLQTRLGQIIFYKDGEVIRALNQDPNSWAALYFPEGDTDEVDGLTLFLPPLLDAGSAVGLNVSLAFQDYAKAGVDEFVITPTPPLGASGTGQSTGGQQRVRLQATRSRPAPANASMKLGSFFQFEVNGTNRTIRFAMAGGFVLGAILLLKIRGAGPTTTTMLDPWRKDLNRASGDGPDDAIVELPVGLDVSDGVTYLEILAEAAPAAGTSVMGDWMKENSALFSPLKSEHHAILAAAAAKAQAELRITSRTAPPGTVGDPYEFDLTASDGKTPYTWTVEGILPAGLTLDPSGKVHGTPTSATLDTVVVKVVDAEGARAEAYLDFIIQPKSGAPSDGSS